MAQPEGFAVCRPWRAVLVSRSTDGTGTRSNLPKVRPTPYAYYPRVNKAEPSKSVVSSLGRLQTKHAPETKLRHGMYVSLPRASCRHRVQQRRLDLPGRRISANRTPRNPPRLPRKNGLSRPVHALSPAGGYGTRVVAAPVSSRAPQSPPAGESSPLLAGSPSSRL